MRFEGTLERWHDDRGFGFITPARGGAPIFVHISAFPLDGRRPKEGEALTFEVEPTADGKKRAIKVERPGAPRVNPMRAVPKSRRPRPTRSRWSTFAGGVVVVLFVLGGFALYERLSGPRSTAPASLDSAGTLSAPPGAAPSFRCDGRTFCSQMTSCEEAKFFLKNCPGTQMDGDRNGIPCEKQWCTRRNR